GLWRAGLVAVGPGAPQYAKPTGVDAPTFTKDVAPILYKSCTNCHRPGEIAPMSLLTFKDARPWAKSIREKVSQGLMPPWHADPTHGEFVNDRRLNDAEKDTILKWVAAGGPEGNPADLPPQPAVCKSAPDMEQPKDPEKEAKKKGPANDRPAPQRMGSFVGGFAPGQNMRLYEPGQAIKVPAGSVLVFQMHYTPNGTATAD